MFSNSFSNYDFNYGSNCVYYRVYYRVYCHVYYCVYYANDTGNIVTFLRSVTQEQKALAVAMTSFWHSLFVSIPYPLIYGKIFDDSCIVWSKTCDKRGNCWLYDTNKLRTTYHTVSIVLIAIGSIFDFIMIFLSPRLNDLYGEEAKKNAKQAALLANNKKLLEQNNKAEEEEEVFAKNNISPLNRPIGNQNRHVESSF